MRAAKTLVLGGCIIAAVVFIVVGVFDVTWLVRNVGGGSLYAVAASGVAWLFFSGAVVWGMGFLMDTKP